MLTDQRIMRANKYLRFFEYDELLAQDEKDFKLLINGISIINGVPNNSVLIKSFIKQMGRLMTEARNMNEGSVYHVTSITTNSYFNSYAQSHFEFPLHSDCSSELNPPDGVALYCVENASIGGVSKFTSLEDILKNTPSQMKAFLLRKEMKFGDINAKIIQKDNHSCSIRYNRITLESYNEIDPAVSKNLDKWDHLVDSLSFPYHLKPGQLCVFNNNKFLHGRTAFPEGSKRFLKRIRFYS